MFWPRMRGPASGETVVVTRGAEVRRVDNGSRGTLTTSDNTVLVLALADPDAALAVAHASQAGKVTIVRATGVHELGSRRAINPRGAEHGTR